jgi:hypothetical protein
VIGVGDQDAHLGSILSVWGRVTGERSRAAVENPRSFTGLASLLRSNGIEEEVDMQRIVRNFFCEFKGLVVYDVMVLVIDRNSVDP